ncbi:hypothetical protein UlMin_031261 [Ulmus minor]
MQYRPLEITVISAKGLKNSKHLTKMDVYVLVSLTGGPQMEQKTPLDKDGGINPNWNFPMNFNIDEEEAEKDHLVLTFKVKCHRRIHSDKDLGEVSVPVKELLDNGGDGKFVKYVSYQLRKPNGKQRGELNLSYKFANRALETWPSTMVNETAATAYPPPPAGFPPSAGGFGFSPNFSGGLTTMLPSPMGFPFYGSGMGHGYPQVVQPQRPAHTELDAAFLSGVLSGLFVSEMLTDQAAAAYNDEYSGDQAKYEAGPDGGHQVGGGDQANY